MQCSMEKSFHRNYYRSIQLHVSWVDCYYSLSDETAFHVGHCLPPPERSLSGPLRWNIDPHLPWLLLSTLLKQVSDERPHTRLLNNVMLTNYSLVTPYGDRDLGQLGNRLLPGGTKSFSEPILANHQCDLVALSWENFTGNTKYIYPWYVFGSYKLIITTTFPRGQWVKSHYTSQHSTHWKTYFI